MMNKQVTRTLLSGGLLALAGAALIAQAPYTVPPQLAMNKPSEPLIPTLEQCNEFDREWSTYLGKVNEIVRQCLGRPKTYPISVGDLGPSCLEYYGGPGPCRSVDRACISIWNEWYTLANERKAALGRCHEKADFFKRAVELVRQDDEEQKSRDRQIQQNVNDAVRKTGEKAFGDSIPGKVFDKALEGIGKANDATLKEAEKLKAEAESKPTPQSNPAVSASTVTAPQPWVAEWRCRAVSSTNQFYYAGMTWLIVNADGTVLSSNLGGTNFTWTAEGSVVRFGTADTFSYEARVVGAQLQLKETARCPRCVEGPRVWVNEYSCVR